MGTLAVCVTAGATLTTLALAGGTNVSAIELTQCLSLRGAG